MAERAKLFLFWDYDTQWGADCSRTAGGPKSWGPLEFVNTEKLLELHERYEIPACFAVVGAAALPGERPYHDPGQIRRIHEAGHEIASHAHRHEWLPGLDGMTLRQTLRFSKDALEQCIGAPVASFVPPFNQPFDYAQGLSFSLSERRAVRSRRTDLRRLCEALAECGFQFCRVAYRPIVQRAIEWLARRRLDRPVEPEQIAGITCVRVNTPGGFTNMCRQVLLRCVAEGGCVVVYGHPHSLYSGNSQSQEHFVPFLEAVCSLRRAGKLSVCLPRYLLTGV